MKRLVLLIILMIFDCDCVSISNASFEGDVSSIRLHTSPVDRMNVTNLRVPSPVEHEMPTSSHVLPLEHQPPFRPHTPSIEYAMPYIPQYYDHTEEFHNESITCLKLCKWAFQPISVILQLTAGGFFISGQCCIDKYPESSKILNGIGLGVSAISLIVNILLLKIDDKLEDMDDYTLQRRDAQNRENQIYPAIIQR